MPRWYADRHASKVRRVLAREQWHARDQAQRTGARAASAVGSSDRAGFPIWTETPAFDERSAVCVGARAEPAPVVLRRTHRRPGNLEVPALLRDLPPSFLE